MNDLGKRMKENYESRSCHRLTRRTPVIIRVDGRAFHTVLKDAKRPFDMKYIIDFRWCAGLVSQHIQGFKLGYCQSDEVSFLLTDFDTLQTEPWFDYRVDKLCSITASLMSMYFKDCWGTHMGFDARAFNIPKEEVSNYFLWRAKDWHRNSVQMHAQSLFSHRKLRGKKTGELLQMIEEAGENWVDNHAANRNGTFFGNGWITSSVRPTYEEINALVEEAVNGARESLPDSGHQDTPVEPGNPTGRPVSV